MNLVRILSHGSATVEGGFSVNKDLLILVVSVLEETVVAQTVVFDVILNAGMDIKNVDITDDHCCETAKCCIQDST